MGGCCYPSSNGKGRSKPQSDPVARCTQCRGMEEKRWCHGENCCHVGEGTRRGYRMGEAENYQVHAHKRGCVGAALPATTAGPGEFGLEGTNTFPFSLLLIQTAGGPRRRRRTPHQLLLRTDSRRTSPSRTPQIDFLANPRRFSLSCTPRFSISSVAIESPLRNCDQQIQFSPRRQAPRQPHPRYFHFPSTAKQCTTQCFALIHSLKCAIG